MYRNKKQKSTPESAKEALSALLPLSLIHLCLTKECIGYENGVLGGVISALTSKKPTAK